MNVMNCHGGGLDYLPCHYGSARLVFRGPQRRLRGAYVACLGGTETFGPYIRTPWPALVEQALGVPCINLGSRGAGIDGFLGSPGLVDIAAMAKVTVIEVLGAVAMSNRFYTVDPRRPERLVRASKKLKAIYPETDFTRFERVDAMLAALARECPDRLQLVRREMQAAWVARMRSLVAQAAGPVVLLWLAAHPPYEHGTGSICQPPLFVDRAMLRAICGGRVRLVEVVVPPEDRARGLEEMVFPPSEEPAARAMLGPAAHRRAAERLGLALRSCL
jgi:hypothetical protein